MLANDCWRSLTIESCFILVVSQQTAEHPFGKWVVTSSSASWTHDSGGCWWVKLRKSLVKDKGWQRQRTPEGARFQNFTSIKFHKISSLLFELWVPPFTESGSCLLAAQGPTYPKHLNLEMIDLSRIATGVTRSSRMYQNPIPKAPTASK